MGTGITVAMLTHNELTEFRWLVEALVQVREIFDEIVIVDDFSEPDFIDLVEKSARELPIRFFQRALGTNFAGQRNYMKSLCRGRLIFFLDPDELPPIRILQGLPRISDFMEEMDIDACQLPRLNISLPSGQPVHPTLLDLEDISLKTFWEDQFRILRNLPHLRWTLRLNEYLIGVRRAYRFPHEREYALLHCKSHARQARQRIFYRSIWLRHPSRIKNSIVKRLPWRTRTEWISTKAPV